MHEYRQLAADRWMFTQWTTSSLVKINNKVTATTNISETAMNANPSIELCAVPNLPFAS
jgi:hypothetical protein